MTDLKVPKKSASYLMMNSIALANAKLNGIMPDYRSVRGSRITLCMWTAVLLLMGVGAFTISMYRHHTSGFITYTKSFFAGDDGEFKYQLQQWPVPPPYVNTFSAHDLQTVETEMIEYMSQRPEYAPLRCIHAASLGVAIDTLIIVIGEDKYIIRNIVGIEYLGETSGVYHRSLVDMKQLAFVRLYPELKLEFISALHIGSMMKQQTPIKSPYHVKSPELAYCIQLYYPKQKQI
jgi:hypothetical protein